MVEELKELECIGMPAFDAHLQVEVLVVAPVLCFIGEKSSGIRNHESSRSRVQNVLQDLHG